MSTPSKLHRLCVFMTPADEARFSDAVRTSLPAVRFVDASQQPETPLPTFRSSLSECAGPHVTLVDTSIISESTFHRDYVVRHPSGRGWVYAIVGSGLASLVRSRSEDDSLRNGEVRASVPTEDARTAEYIRELTNLVRAGGTGVFAVDPLTGDTARRAERNFVAWPDAASRFGARAAPSLTNGPTAWFTVDR
ncbi:hypothetical protein GCM10010489_26970 [Microbacterium saperdae]|uniref:Uncharacterized protein n=1 Tax=Microbacterium saperdae TaxID=69368 RepID=A0A543BLI6_9MICO|nr:hypothetical protein FB560_1299 [Microbacterium saperdae]GGM53908.1 hypothetical protein GCM10010489_26970 [Microbacterium saperdae]